MADREEEGKKKKVLLEGEKQSTERVAQDAIHVEQKYETLVPRPIPEEIEALKRSISLDGQRDPIVVDETGAVLDGHTRFCILRKLEREIKFEVKSFQDEESKENFVIESAILRRNLNTFQKIELAQSALERERKRAKQRQREGKKKGAGTLGSIEPKIAQGKAIEIVAQRFGIARPTFSRGQFVLEHATSVQKASLRRGKATIGGMYAELRGKSRKQATLKSDKKQEQTLGSHTQDSSLNIPETRLLQEESKGGALYRNVHCEGCDTALTRGELKRVLLCQSCRKTLAMDW